MDSESNVDQTTTYSDTLTTQKHLPPLVSWSVIVLLVVVSIGLVLLYSSTTNTSEISINSDIVEEKTSNHEFIKKLTPSDVDKAMNEKLSEDNLVSHSAEKTAELESLMNQSLPAGERNTYTAEEVRAAMEQ